MHVMIATDGSLDATKSARMAACLAGDDGKVTVLTVIEVPRGLLDDMRSAAADSAMDKAREISSEHRQTQAPDPPVSHWVGDDAVLKQYVKSKVRSRTHEPCDRFGGYRSRVHRCRRRGRERGPIGPGGCKESQRRCAMHWHPRPWSFRRPARIVIDESGAPGPLLSGSRTLILTVPASSEQPTWVTLPFSRELQEIPVD